MITNSYSTSRMWALTKRYAVENRRNILITFGVMFGLILLYSIVMTKALSTSDESLTASRERTVILWMSYVWMAAIIVQVLGSLTFSSMSTKSKRISNMMLPAAQSEKFISQCLLYVVGGNIAMILSFILADAVSALIFGIAPGWTMMSGLLDLQQLFHESPEIIQGAFLIAFGFLLMYLMGQAIYVLGSALWPKKSFLKTFIALFAIQILIPIIIPFGIFTRVVPDLISWFEAINVNEGWFLAWSALAAGYILLGGVYFLAWLRFKRLEIVKQFLN